jgi:hypothetical protein
VAEKYLKREVGASIRTHRFQLRKLIDEGKPKPPKIRKELWKKLVDERGTKEAQAKSTTMASIAKNRGQGNSTWKRVEQAGMKCISVLVFNCRLKVAIVP